MIKNVKSIRWLCLAAGFFALHLSGMAHAKPPSIEITIANHLFIPDIIEIPAGQKVRLIITNKDNTPEEFESYELNREKIIVGNSKTVIFIGPLAPGDYPFFGEFNPKTAQGVVKAR